MDAPVRVDDLGSGFAGDDDAGRRVPGLVTEEYRGVEAARGYPHEVCSGGTEHADALGQGRESLK